MISQITISLKTAVFDGQDSFITSWLGQTVICYVDSPLSERRGSTKNGAIICPEHIFRKAGYPELSGVELWDSEFLFIV